MIRGPLLSYRVPNLYFVSQHLLRSYFIIMMIIPGIIVIVFIVPIYRCSWGN